MSDILTGPRWAARLDAKKASGDYGDLLRVVASYYEMYGRGYQFLSPWINRNRDATMVIPPDKDTMSNALGKPRANIHHIARRNFVDALYNFACQSKGKKQLINPDPATHHSAQFPAGSFSIRHVGKESHIDLFGCSEPLIVSGLQLPLDSISFIIVRPKLGKLGTASVTRWEVLFYRTPHGYLIDHVDSTLNPRWAGIM
jgi:hypothetical protein